MLTIEIKERIKQKIIDFFQTEKLFENLKVDKKADNTVVTEVDYFICKTVKAELAAFDKTADYNYFSEEDHDKLLFPASILDPIDGTRGLLEGFPECSLSLALMKTGKISEGWGWIYNPFTGLSIYSDEIFQMAPNTPKGKLLGLVSRSEWDRGLYAGFDSGPFVIAPKGSIAFKLGILASGGCDFVITKRPKHIWDIAAGTINCYTRGIYLYGRDGKIETLESKKSDSPMLWCREEHFELLKGLLK
ncbi:MAG: hypothetical protein DRQ88_05135 [Epsilonproteobacteria bacterium]|nr:MAG: hypothetical protein DRQ89_04620 [Campylobacterota bacterium]RLA66812.1 MAG: hypothetical protein DRQ88_05135 [Campylobacterota bacterium]